VEIKKNILYIDLYILEMHLVESIVMTSTVLLGSSLVAYHAHKHKDVAAAAGLLAALSALQLASEENRTMIKGVAASVWGYLSHKIFTA
tara:strand:- start:98 stop:364 length:267 start_codon:yes stop_codon:yes gene_type:complete